jgi:5-methylcytosine-specific restriction protein A
MITVATEVDHVIPHRGDPLLFWAISNCVGLCHAHHAEKTARGE